MKRKSLLFKTSILFGCLFLSGLANLKAQTLLYSNDFESGLNGSTIVGSGAIENSNNAAHGMVFHNAVGGQAVRTNYLSLPSNVFANLQSTATTALTISFWVNKGTATGYFYCPLFSAYGAAPTSAGNGMPMMILQTRGLVQSNVGGTWSDYTGAQNVKSANTMSSSWIDDGNWHFYTAIFTTTSAKVYIDGAIMNEWTLSGTAAGGSDAGLFSSGSSLSYICLGGNQAWNFNDPDPAFLFDKLKIYSGALTSTQISSLIATDALTTSNSPIITNGDLSVGGNASVAGILVVNSNITSNSKISSSALAVSTNGSIMGSLGVGTLTPGQPLDIEKNADYQFRVGNNAGNGYNVGRNGTTGYLTFYGDQSGSNGYSFGGVNGTRMTIDGSGDVGIGISTPAANTKLDIAGKLHVNGDIYGSTILTFQDASSFPVTSSIISNLTNSPFSMPKYGIAAPNVTESADLWISGNNAIRMFTAGNATPVLNILSNGYVGIGSLNPDATLTVNGKIHATEVVVDVSVPADYVFKPAYHLMPLNEVEKYVTANSHLPEIESADQIIKDGMSVGEMQNKLLQKVEELTLYMIEQQKTINQQSAKIEELEKKIQ